MKRKNIILIAIIIIFILVFAISGIVLFKFMNKNDKNNNDSIIIKKNVTVITDKTEPKRQPIKVTDDELIFSENPHYSKNDVIVAGIIDAAPEGFIRRVLSIKKNGSQYIVKTEYAVLTDVFEELHLTKNFILTPNGVNETDSNNKSRTRNHDMFQNISYKKTKFNSHDTSSTTNMLLSTDENTGYQFYQEFEEEIEDNISLSGSVGFNIWEELTFDISHNNIAFGLALHNETDGELFLGCNKDAEKNYQKEILKKYLPAYQFMVSGIPIVVTNEVLLDINGNTTIEGSFGTSFGLESENTSGFLYDSKSGKVEDITDKNYLSDGLDWGTEAKMSGECSASALLHLVSKLYGCTGADIAVGISGNANGEVSTSVKKSTDGLNYAGSIDLAIEPKLQGTLVVSVPIIDNKLIEQPLFRVKIKPFWEKHWESSANWKIDLENSEASEDLELKNSYRTKLADVDMVTVPTFQFDYPDSWSITTEMLHQVPNIMETVTLTNDRGVEVTYVDLDSPAIDYGRTMYTIDVTKEADSAFIPGYIQAEDNSYLGNFIVAKIKVTGELSMDTDSEYTQVDGPVSYAVLPESYSGIQEDIRNCGYYKGFSYNYFPYPTGCAFFAESPDGTFTKEEEKEVIAILSSFKEVQ